LGRIVFRVEGGLERRIGTWNRSVLLEAQV
jgi:hypothetical protein